MGQVFYMDLKGNFFWGSKMWKNICLFFLLSFSNAPYHHKTLSFTFFDSTKKFISWRQSNINLVMKFFTLLSVPYLGQRVLSQYTYTYNSQPATSGVTYSYGTSSVPSNGYSYSYGSAPVSNVQYASSGLTQTAATQSYVQPAVSSYNYGTQAPVASATNYQYVQQ